MEIALDHIGKKYGNTWIFRNLCIDIDQGERLAVLGANGSGKTSLLKVMAGLVTPNEGHIRYTHSGTEIQDKNPYPLVAIAAPWLEFPDELKVNELASFYLKLKRPASPFHAAEFLPSSRLESCMHKKVQELSSGQIQRLRLSLCSLSEAPLLLFDEPSVNLDHQGLEFYTELIEKSSSTSTIIVCSNHQDHEIHFCKKNLIMEDFHVHQHE